MDADISNLIKSMDTTTYPSTPATVGDEGASVVTAACVNCRAKHLKCNGEKPCPRCLSRNQACSYVQSRRGYRPRRRVTAAYATSSLPVGQALQSSLNYSSPRTPSRENKKVTDDPKLLSESGVSPNLNTSARSTDVASTVDYEGSPLSMVNIGGRCFEAFFTFAHSAHPFVLPKAHLLNLLKNSHLPHLEAAIRFIGSFYVQSAIPSVFAEEAIKLVSEPTCPRDGFLVQANLLVAIGLDGSAELRQALFFLNQAERIALEIGLNQEHFAAFNGQGSSILEESWRRTWWELFVVEGMIAGVHQQSSFGLYDVASAVLLPCEEHEYISGNIPPSRSLEEFEDADLSGDDSIFSSYTYRIAAIRNLGRILRLPHVLFDDDPVIAQTDAYLMSWNLHLPPIKRSLVIDDGKIDEMLFQAQMITNASTIILHKQHSQLDTSRVYSINSCAPHRHVPGGEPQNIHAAKIIQATHNISELIALPGPLVKHTHFFTCVITLASIINLSRWAALLPPMQDETLKQEIRLQTGALKRIATVWPSARRVQMQVKDVAKEVYYSHKLAAGGGFWNTSTSDEMMMRLVEDENMIEELASVESIQ